MSQRDPSDTNAPTAIFHGTVQPIEEVDADRGERLKEAGHRDRDPPAVASDTERFRPRQRPPFPVLLVFDDDQRSAESVRIRRSPFRIGRVEGDLTIPLDSQMSGAHAEISMDQTGGRNEWCLKDLGSTNGTFVRVSNVILKPGQILMVGHDRLRFEVGIAEPAPEKPVGATQPWSPNPTDCSTDASLVQIDQGRVGKRFPLAGAECWIGNDAQKSSIVLDDSSVNRRHARVFRDDGGRWQVANNHSRNGLWTQVDQISLTRSCYIQCGEQRFLFRLT